MKRGIDDEIDGNAEKMAKLQGKYQPYNQITFTFLILDIQRSFFV